MWRRACLGDRDAVISLGYLWVGVCIAVLVVVAARVSWPAGFLGAASVAVALLAVYRWRRHRWNRWIRRQGLEGIAAVEVMLRQRSQG